MTALIYIKKKKHQYKLLWYTTYDVLLLKLIHGIKLIKDMTLFYYIYSMKKQNCLVTNNLINALSNYSNKLKSASTFTHVRYPH